VLAGLQSLRPAPITSRHCRATSPNEEAGQLRTLPQRPRRGMPQTTSARTLAKTARRYRITKVRAHASTVTAPAPMWIQEVRRPGHLAAGKECHLVSAQWLARGGHRAA